MQEEQAQAMQRTIGVTFNNSLDSNTIIIEVRTLYYSCLIFHVVLNLKFFFPASVCDADGNQTGPIIIKPSTSIKLSFRFHKLF